MTLPYLSLSQAGALTSYHLSLAKHGLFIGKRKMTYKPKYEYFPILHESTFVLNIGMRSQFEWN